jgi:hypothetical protein
MKHYLFPIYLATGYLLVFISSIFANLHISLILLLFALSPVLMIWMVYKVLCADVDVKETFEEKWYSDL